MLNKPCLTDKEIIKALTEWSDRAFTFCNVGMPEFARHILILIHRQQALIEALKAEIERLKYNLKAVLDERADHSEAIKEFWSRIQGVAYQSEREWSHGEHPMLVELDDVKEIYEEMVSDSNAE